MACPCTDDIKVAVKEDMMYIPAEVKESLETAGVDATVAVKVYVAALEHAAKLAERGLVFYGARYPAISPSQLRQLSGKVEMHVWAVDAGNR